MSVMKSRFKSEFSPSVESRMVGKFQNSSPVRYGKGDALRLVIGSAIGGRLGDFVSFDDGKVVSKRDDLPTDNGVDTADNGLGGGHE
jgi:hypothetical protein